MNSFNGGTSKLLAKTEATNAIEIYERKDPRENNGIFVESNFQS